MVLEGEEAWKAFRRRVLFVLGFKGLCGHCCSAHKRQESASHCWVWNQSSARAWTHAAAAGEAHWRTVSRQSASPRPECGSPFCTANGSARSRLGITRSRKPWGSLLPAVDDSVASQGFCRVDRVSWQKGRCGLDQ